MKEDNDNIIVMQSKKFAIRCINLYKYITET